VAFFCLLTIVVFFGLGEGSGEDALPYTWADLIAATVLWLAGVAAGVLIFSEPASPDRYAAPAAAFIQLALAQCCQGGDQLAIKAAPDGAAGPAIAPGLSPWARPPHAGPHAARDTTKVGPHGSRRDPGSAVFLGS
jgi:hypothetical protein